MSNTDREFRWRVAQSLADAAAREVMEIRRRHGLGDTLDIARLDQLQAIIDDADAELDRIEHEAGEEYMSEPRE